MISLYHIIKIDNQVIMVKIMIYIPQYRSPQIFPYDRLKAVNYSHEWAMKRNPKYFDFEKYGGDCTNFVSQVLFEGSGIMNYTPVYGWYYINSYKRTASWTGVDYLYNFLVNNRGEGPFAVEVDEKDVQPGDIVQLAFSNGKSFDHSPVVIQVGTPTNLNNIKIAAHSYDRDYYHLTDYNWVRIRFLHILGVRKYKAV